MRVLVQRVTRARVLVGDEVAGAIGTGLVLLVGITHSDTSEDVAFMAKKVAHLRIFDDDTGALNRSALDVHAIAPGTAAMLVVSQFTLYADARKGRRPSFTRAAPPSIAAPLVEQFAEALRAYGLPVARGRFGAEMLVELVNDGPVTIWLDSAELRGLSE
ncbi:MAG: D-aminoacyl-tRNA deacylase [Thermomicrobiales bacterium]|nr:MAG: D-aminoacyl-tRNA deacylase [Thermomicrobiales bacterium]